MPDEEARALDAAEDFLLGLGSGRIKVTGRITELRAEARRIMRHYPLAPGARWAGEDR